MATCNASAGAGRVFDVTLDQMWLACSMNSVEAVAELFPNADPAMWAEPLNLVVCQGYVEVARFLWDNMEEYDVVAYTHGHCPLHAACSAGRPEMVKFLMERLSDFAVSGYDALATTPLNRACAFPDTAVALEIALLLLDRLPLERLWMQNNTYHREEMQGTPLHVACGRKNTELVRYFVEHVEAKDLFKSDMMGRVPVERLFKDLPVKGPDPSRAAILASILQATTASEQRELTRSLDPSWRTVLLSNDVACVRTMYDWLQEENFVLGARMTTPPLHTACLRDCGETLAFLLSVLPEKYIRATFAESTTTPLHIAAREGSESCLRVLLSTLPPECVNVPDEEGRPPELVVHPPLAHMFQPRVKSAAG
mmetsp:Transcript_8443/g.35282  ORF Transcript_8443/g.35282 Transcript_8443/m.35282 type:complete len:368 (+) Transcript_8443:115-1218(+)